MMTSASTVLGTIGSTMGSAVSGKIFNIQSSIASCMMGPQIALSKKPFSFFILIQMENKQIILTKS